MKKNDVLIVVFLSFLSVILYFVLGSDAYKGDVAVIYCDGKEYARLPLSQDCEIDVEQKNIICIEDGKVFVKSATCPDKLCVHQSPINTSGRDIICLPNRVRVTVISQEKSDVDTIAR